MKRTSKFLAILLILSLSISILASCASDTDDGETAEEAVENALNAIKAEDEESIEEYFNFDELIEEYGEIDIFTNGEDNNLEDIEGDLEEIEERVESLDIGNIYEKLEFEILSSKEQADTALVETKIRNIDMGELIGRYMSEVFALAMENLYEKDENYEEKVEELLSDILESEDIDLVTSTVDISLIKEDNNWEITMDKELADAITGGFFTMIESLEDLDIEG